MASHSSILTWKIPWTEEPGGLSSPWGQSESNTATELTRMHDSVPPMVLGSGDITVRQKCKKWHFRDFPGGLVARTLFSQCKGPRVQGVLVRQPALLPPLAGAWGPLGVDPTLRN